MPVESFSIQSLVHFSVISVCSRGVRFRLSSIPVAFEAGAAYSRDAQWGDMNVAFEGFPAGMDTRPLFKGLPEDRCQCPHWGVVLKGRLRALYASSEEVITSGQAYYLAPGHNVVIEEDCELIEFSPQGRVPADAASRRPQYAGQSVAHPPDRGVRHHRPSPRAGNGPTGANVARRMRGSQSRRAEALTAECVPWRLRFQDG